MMRYNQLHLSSIRDVGFVRQSAVSQMPWTNVARKLRRRYRPSMSLWTLPIRPAQNRRRDDLHVSGQTIGHHASAAGDKNLPLLCIHRPQIPARHHDGGRGAGNRLEQQGNGSIIDSITGARAYPKSKRKARHCRGFRMEDHDSRRSVFS